MNNTARHARRPAPEARKPFLKILADAAFTAVVGAVLAGTGYWAAVQWIDAFSYTGFGSAVIETDTHYIVFTD